ncbi:hypothetical protein [Cryptosporangium sp. NPDC048952]|uniref:hypothetical protein n=1 Tax=Cryptosporangium sp. NPDC048952 TaxID=3363961 RepID=UPI00371A712F
MTAVVSIVTGALALCGVALGAWLGARNTSRQWTRDAQLRACQRLLERYAAIYDMLARSRRGEAPAIDWASWNHALTEISLLCTPVVVDSAYALDEAIWRLTRAVDESHSSQDEWAALRRPVESAHSTLIHAIRRQFDPEFRGTIRTSGRPADDDELWRRNVDGQATVG